MKDNYFLKTWEENLLSRIPLLSYYSQTRGWSFVLSWLHRLTGLGIILFIWFHLYTLQDLLSPSIYDAKMRFYSLPFLRFCEWLLSLPVFFHALNGGRLILYESFRFRDDEGLIRWTTGLVMLFSGLLAILMIIGNQDVSALFFWMMTLALAIVLVIGGGMRIWRTENTLTWKCQRLSSIFLLVMIPAHFFFMHLNAAAAKESSLVILRMGQPFIKIIDASLVIAIFYHAGFGLISLTKDYTSQESLHQIATLLVIIVMGFSSLMGIRLILAI